MVVVDGIVQVVCVDDPDYVGPFQKSTSFPPGPLVPLHPPKVDKISPRQKLTRFRSLKDLVVVDGVVEVVCVDDPHHEVEHVAPLVPLHVKVDVRLPGKEISNGCGGARPVHLIITMIKWIRTSRLSKKNSLSLLPCSHQPSGVDQIQAWALSHFSPGRG